MTILIENIKNIPDILKATPRWVGWKPITRDGKLTKPPVNIWTGQITDAQKSEHWADFGTAVQVFQQGDLQGLGFVLTDDDDLVGVDLDHAVEAGVVAEWAWKIALHLNSYTEISPSGTGLHIWVHGRLPEGGRKKGHIETYSASRYLTVTGQRYPDFPATIQERHVDLASFHAEVFARTRSATNGTRPASATTGPDDMALIKKALRATNGAKFARLWRGDTLGYPSHSEADLALCGLLAFWTGRDAVRMDGLFRQSGLRREKWDARHGGETYGQRTIGTAIGECTEVYEPKPTRSKRPFTEEEIAAAHTFVGSGRGADDGDEAGDQEHDPYPEMWKADPKPTRGVDESRQPDSVDGVDEAPASPPQVVSKKVNKKTSQELPAGFISRYVAVALRSTDAPAEAHALTAALVMSALAGPCPRLPLAFRRDAGQRLVLWGMNVVDSTEGRKTTVNELGLDVLRRVLGESAILPWKGSPEAFIQLMAARDGQTCVLPRDEYTGLLVGIKHGGYMAGLAQDFIRAYDGLPIVMGRTAKMNRQTGHRVDDTDRVRDPYLVKMTASTRSRFVEVATIDDVLDGLLARFIYTSGGAPEQPMKRRTVDLDTAWTQVVALAQAFYERAQDVPTIEISDALMITHFNLEQQFKAAATAAARPDAAKPAMKRLAVSVLQIAGLLALERAHQGAAVLTEADLDAAVALSPPWQATTLALIADIGRTQHQARCDSVLATVRSHPEGVARGLLFRLHRGLKGREFEEVVGDLEQQGLIHQRKVSGKAGRAPVVYRPGPRP
jgi:putative DNA primase/helicase